MGCAFAEESSMQEAFRGRMVECCVPRPRARSVDSATALPSQHQLLQEVEYWRQAAIEARVHAEELQEELVQLHEAVLSSSNDEGKGAAASRYVARLAKENYHLGYELGRLEQLTSAQRMYANEEESWRKRSPSRDSDRSSGTPWASACSSPMTTPRVYEAPLVPSGIGLAVKMKRLNFQNLKPDLDDDGTDCSNDGRNAELPSCDGHDTTRSGTSESSELSSASESDHNMIF